MNPFKPTITIIDIPANGSKENLPTIHILHGIHRSDPLHGPGNWAKYFTDAGFPVRIWDYGHVYALTARFLVNPYVVDRVVSEIKYGDILVGHSNGCAIIADVADKTAIMIGGVMLLNPALNVERRIPCDVPWVHVYCNKGDMAVTAGKRWRQFNPVSWFIRHPYGEQGKYGPNFTDQRYQVFHGETPPNGLTVVDGHSHINDPKTLETWGPFGVQKVLDSINKRV